jgi:hypothetical protein
LKQINIGTLVVSLMVATLALLGAAPAKAAGCVTKAEYNAVKKGWKQTSVHAKFGTAGKRVSIASSGGYVSEVRTYTACSRYSVVSVAYSKNPGGVLRLSAKSAVWVG